MTRIYTLAKTLIKNTPAWPSGHSVTIWSSGAVKINVESGPTNGGRLDLALYNGKRIAEQCGYLSPMEGWVFTLTQEVYEGWVKRCGGQIKPTTQKLCGDCRADGQAVWWDVGTCAGCGSERVSLWGFPTLSEDFDPQPNDIEWLAREWADHERARTARRHPDQLYFDRQAVSR